MAAFPLLSVYILLSFLLISDIPNCLSAGRPIEAPVPTVHELLQQYGFPKGLMPRSAKAYSLSADGTFEVELEGTCYITFKNQLVYYDATIKGKLRHGSVSSVSGIQTKKFFLWVPVTAINADETSGMLEFHVGALSEKLPAKQFDKIHNCEKQAGGWRQSGVSI
ncbi:uncharacterized protein LOC124925252 [Impatiens glandulifera]|uniref:uncharacterized protein LOC124925252 n=1 Tax=Impatiens glandulifera TaxID=253017 RepID=UPI001FB12062|nr:uncharacterized protein LOC124925252 [Impatiens glandulifera]